VALPLGQKRGEVHYPLLVPSSHNPLHLLKCLFVYQIYLLRSLLVYPIASTTNPLASKKLKLSMEYEYYSKNTMNFWVNNNVIM